MYQVSEIYDNAALCSYERKVIKTFKWKWVADIYAFIKRAQLDPSVAHLWSYEVQKVVPIWPKC
jgi:hypothetical protein